MLTAGQDYGTPQDVDPFHWFSGNHDIHIIFQCSPETPHGGEYHYVSSMRNIFSIIFYTLPATGWNGCRSWRWFATTMPRFHPSPVVLTRTTATTTTTTKSINKISSIAPTTRSTNPKAPWRSISLYVDDAHCLTSLWSLRRSQNRSIVLLHVCDIKNVSQSISTVTERSVNSWATQMLILMTLIRQLSRMRNGFTTDTRWV